MAASWKRGLSPTQCEERTVKEILQEQRQNSYELVKGARGMRDCFDNLKYYPDYCCSHPGIRDNELLEGDLKQITFFLTMISGDLEDKVEDSKGFMIEKSTEEIEEIIQYWENMRLDVDDKHEDVFECCMGEHESLTIGRLQYLVEEYIQSVEKFVEAFDLGIQLQQRLSEHGL
jgi:hypothetical protein